MQNETFSPQANEIPNTAASWLPGDDYYTNFHEGDPFIKVPEGYARLPGAGYEALHPELEGINPEDYPDIHKMAILTDVAPYSREYHTYRQKVGKQAQGDTELEIEYERILTRVKKTRSLRPAEPKTPHAHAPGQAIDEQGLASSWLFIDSSNARSKGPSVLPYPKTLARARQTEAPPMIPPRSILACSLSSGVASSNGFSVLPYPSRARRTPALLTGPSPV